MERAEGPKEKTFGGESTLTKPVERPPLMCSQTKLHQSVTNFSLVVATVDVLGTP